MLRSFFESFNQTNDAERHARLYLAIVETLYP